MVAGADREVSAVKNEAWHRAGISRQLPEVDRQPETVRLTYLVNIFGRDIGARVSWRVVPALLFGFTGKPASVVPMFGQSRR